MSELPIISGKDLAKALTQLGFIITRQKGSHYQMRHPDGRCTTIPMHNNKDMPRGTLHGIIKDIDISADTLQKLI